MDRTVRRVAVVFLVVAVALTWPLVVQPDRIYLTAPDGYDLVQESGDGHVDHVTGTREFIDHGGHTDAVDRASARLRNGQFPFDVNPEYTVPPTYVIPGAVATLVVPTVVFHNAFFVGSVFLAGLFAFLLVREVVGDPHAALLAGVLYASSFYLFNEYALGHTNQWQIQWIPLILLGVERVRRRANVRSVGLLGVAFALQTLSSEQYAVYLSLFLPLYLIARYWSGVESYARRRFCAGFGAAGGLAAVLTLPYLLARLSMAAGTATQTRSLAENATPIHVTDAAVGAGMFFASTADPQVAFRLLLLGLGVATLLAGARRRRRQLVPFALLFAVGLVLSWGPFAPWAPYTLLYRYWPLVDYFRVPYRTLPFVALGSSAVSAALVLRIPGSDGDWDRRRLAVVAALAGVQVLLVHLVLQFDGAPV